jgi:hypothetical protein
VLLLLRHKRWRTPLLACSTHLYWNPSFPDVKAAQAAVLCQQISAFLAGQVQQGVLASADVPVVIGGDFNSLWRKYRGDAFDEVQGRGEGERGCPAGRVACQGFPLWRPGPAGVCCCVRKQPAAASGQMGGVQRAGGCQLLLPPPEPHPPTSTPHRPALQVPPDAGFVTSGVYTLLSTGELRPDHQDHPYKRQPGGSVSEALQREELRELQLGTAGLALQSAHMMAHGRWAGGAWPGCRWRGAAGAPRARGRCWRGGRSWCG